MDLSMENVLVDNTIEGIPFDLLQIGLSHIGDIDFYNGLIYAPIEGKPSYEHSTIVAYDPDTLQPAGPRFELDRDYLPDGVPWIAIDAARQVAYTSPWNNVGVLNVHSYRAGGDVTSPAITGLTVVNPKLKPGKPVIVDIESSEAASTTATWSRCVGGKKRPCGRLRAAGRPPQIALAAGENQFALEPRSETWAEGKRFNPGRFRLSITPTDQADAIGATSSVNFAVPKPKRQHRR
ncbi:MAG: hypothetical protein JJE13_00850 [Thermoleophilia bacterium]|nr:hypothetical protein [Thermoleophilia bacterium]